MQNLLCKIKEISFYSKMISIPMCNGINTQSNKINKIKEIINSGDYSNITFNQNDIPKIKKELEFNVMEELNNLTKKENFIDQWNKLTEQEKSLFLYFDKEAYKIIRNKIEVEDFNFIFNEYNQAIEIPLIIQNWIDIPKNAKVLLYKLKKESKGTIYEDFFNDSKIKNIENEDLIIKQKEAINYLIDINKSNKLNCWYSRLDMLHNKNAPFSYTYDFFSNLEDEFNGYKDIKEKIKLPEILRKWAGLPSEKELFLYQNEMKTIQRKCKDMPLENMNELINENKNIRKISDLQKGLEKDFLIKLKKEAIGTSFEDFLNHEMTEKMSINMPYVRKNYVFLYFRNDFINQFNMNKKTIGINKIESKYYPKI